MRSWLLLVGVVGCTPPPQPTVDVVVTAAASGAAIKNAAVAVACPIPAVNGAARTDGEGFAHVVVFTEQRSPCIVTISHPAFDPVQLPDLEICAADAECPPLAVALDEVLP